MVQFVECPPLLLVSVGEKEGRQLAGLVIIMLSRVLVALLQENNLNLSLLFPFS